MTRTKTKAKSFKIGMEKALSKTLFFLRGNSHALLREWNRRVNVFLHI